MVTGVMPRRFWVYTAGKDDPRAAEREAKREQRLRWIRETLPGLLALGGYCPPRRVDVLDDAGGVPRVLSRSALAHPDTWLTRRCYA